MKGWTPKIIAAGLLLVALLGGEGKRCTPQATLTLHLWDPAGNPIPGRVTIEGIDGTPDPELAPIPIYDGDLGPFPVAEGTGNRRYTLSGTVTLQIPPGRYRVWASRGLAYTLFETEIEAVADEEILLEARLEEAIDTTGWRSADFHVHARPSSDSQVPLEARIFSLVGEGIEYVAATDHNRLTDYRPVIEALGVGDLLVASVGDEITTGVRGHFNAFPLDAASAPPSPAMPIPAIFEGIEALPGEEVLQVNHPRFEGAGYFDTIALDPQTGATENPNASFAFQAMEVLNGISDKELSLDAPPQTMLDWFHLLSRGYRFTATGNSDSHTLTAEVGYPRNYVAVPEGTDDVEGAVVAAVRAHRVVVSHGPLPTFTVDGVAGIGDLFSPQDATIDLDIVLQVPEWISVSVLEVIGNGERLLRIPLDPDARDRVRFSGRVTLTLSRDTWLILLTGGERPLPDLFRRPVLPAAFTNPIWLDIDGNGRFDPPAP